jgi:polygalacturonase
LIVVKSDKGQGTVQHVVVRNCVLWNQVAHALSIGAELRENIDDVLFTDCDVIHDTGREWTLRIYHCDSALVRNVRFENIRIEQSIRPISLWIGKTKWSVEDQRGNIRDVTFKDISGSAAVPLDIELAGFDATHDIQDVHFENVRFNGQPLTRADVKSNEFVQGVSGL